MPVSTLRISGTVSIFTLARSTCMTFVFSSAVTRRDLDLPMHRLADTRQPAWSEKQYVASFAASGPHADHAERADRTRGAKTCYSVKKIGGCTRGQNPARIL